MDGSKRRHKAGSHGARCRRSTVRRPAAKDFEAQKVGVPSNVGFLIAEHARSQGRVPGNRIRRIHACHTQDVRARIREKDRRRWVVAPRIGTYWAAIPGCKHNVGTGRG